QISQANLSQEFTSTLPVKRSDIVGSIVAVVAMFQLITLLVGAICAPVAMVIFPTGNLVGLDANLAFFGIAFACFAVFNAIFLPNYFKTGYKYGLPLLLGLVGFVVTYGICETLVQVVPSLTALLDGYAAQGIWARAIVLAAGMVAYALCTAFATKRAVKKFEKVSL
ncbi:MAG: ABC-2 transporter permease, partial [Candidatus Fimimonas sp.]